MSPLVSRLKPMTDQDTTGNTGAITANLSPLPDKVGVDGLEDIWRKNWDDSGVNAFQGSRDRKAVFSIDTPPPTVSGSLHVGHVFSYTHTDVIARFKRMQGYDVFYPMGWDDNGLPTERRVQNYYGVRVDTSLKYDPDLKPPFEGTTGKKIEARDQVPISRKNFVELCERLTKRDEQQFEELWRALGLSIDWSQTYHTIGEHPQRVAQKAFLRNLARGEVYQQDAPGLWDVTFQTAVAQAELESREYPGFYHKIAFHFEDGTPIYIETTRPELLAACTSLIANPDDPRYQPYFGKSVYSPLFHVKLPILAHPAAEMDKGAGIAMCCTFGDVTDVQWWRELKLPTRPIIQRNGRIVMSTPDWITDQKGREIFAMTEGKTAFSARKIIVEQLRDSGDLDGEPTPTKRMTNFYEKGDKPLETVTSRQWYLRNGGTDEALNAELIKRGKELQFHPDFMRVRYENWVHGLNGDWLISRQRFFGVPFPLWYRLDEQGEPDYEHPLTPNEDELPIDPTSDVPHGYDESQRDQPNGFMAEHDIMDTWATSSLTPQIVTHWAEPDEASKALFQATFPMDLRPQGQDIIRTWLFSSIDRAHLENHCLPWSHTTLSGWILDPDHKKMSKSKGNVVVPNEPIKKFGADAVRYWAASARLGLDATYDEGQMKIGRRLAIKLLNATKFALAIGREDDQHHVAQAATAQWDPQQITEPLDRAVMASLAAVIDEATENLNAYEHSKALETIETFFWRFCDDYIELVKNRAYGTADATGHVPSAEAIQSARTTLGLGLDAFARLFAPYLPYATEQIWSWMHAPQGSVHRAPWPTSAPYAQAAHGTDPNLLLWAGNALAELRGLKSQAKVSMKTPILHATLTATTDGVEALRQALDDIAEAGRVTGELGLAEAGAGAGAVGAGATGSAGAAVAGSTGSASPANSTPGDTTGTTGTSSDTTTGAESAGEVPEFSVGIADDAELGEPPAKKPKHKG
ncbi:Valyl-tRNA synthetase [Bifidobacterium mongoliense]|uniref:Valine--tRNA ligase n=2 Tax=Bifidobacterium mongoliense TaxID=518643 RepID=A0A423UCU8_9BIFI|nr:Valyl-tRNA synthetase [Bifidobacterium mongoliense]